MQEHIRRAHPEHYISKLPATEESFLRMINTPPSERPPAPPNSSSHPPNAAQAKGLPHTFRRDGSSAPGTPRNQDEYTGAALLPAAAALAQLHNHKIDSGWESEGVGSAYLLVHRRAVVTVF